MKRAWAFGALALLASNAAADEACGPLKIIGRATMISTEGALLVPATVNGLPTKMIIDTGGWYRQLFPVIQDKLKLPTTRRNIVALDITGRKTDKTVTVADFEIGTFKVKYVPFYVPETGLDDQIGGLMGPQMFTIVDLDLDFDSKTVNFISQDHCEGKVVYWKTPAYAAIPFTLGNDGHVRIPVEVDGRKFTALLDTGASGSLMTFRAAEEVFGITKDSPGVTKSGYVNGDTHAEEYQRTFKTLTIAGITFNNPTLALIPDLMRNHMINDHRPPINSHIDTNPDTEGVDDVIVGLEELRHLHVYIAYKEQKVYISPIAPSSSEAAPTPPGDQPNSPEGPR
ncbi:MAG TPA: aspartyl protease family protein [Rhizomicrobium sp.]|nr:aspartyl protease family protein [Rhizomicrobium sp.]